MTRKRPAVHCAAHRSTDGEPCGGWAVHGAKVCAAHGGSAPQVQAAARDRVVLEQAVAKFGLEQDGTPPDQIILREIRRSSAMVCMLAAEVAALSPEDRTWGTYRRKVRQDAEGAEVVETEQRAAEHVLIGMLRAERRELRELIVAAHAAHIEERYIALVEREGRELLTLLDGVLSDFRAAFGLTREQVEHGKTLVAANLRRFGEIEPG